MGGSWQLVKASRSQPCCAVINMQCAEPCSPRNVATAALEVEDSLKGACRASVTQTASCLCNCQRGTMKMCFHGKNCTGNKLDAGLVVAASLCRWRAHTQLSGSCPPFPARPSLLRLSATASRHLQLVLWAGPSLNPKSGLHLILLTGKPASSPRCTAVTQARNSCPSMGAPLHPGPLSPTDTVVHREQAHGPLSRDLQRCW